MISENPRYAFSLAVVLGIAVFFIPAGNYQPLVFAIYFLALGAIFGYLWPQKSWRWGLWLAGPMTILLGFSVLFAGNLDVFVQKDLPILLLTIACACVGSFAGSRYKLKLRAGEN